MVEQVSRSKAIADNGCLWWDARPRPRLGTVEVRIMDAQSRVTDAAALTAAVQCLLHLHAYVQTGSWPRDDPRARLIDDHATARRPARDALIELFDDCGASPPGWAAPPSWREPKRSPAITALPGSAGA